MDKNLGQLIAEYQACVRDAVVLLHRSGVPMPQSSFDWIDADIPIKGGLNGNAEYFKHGAGCEVQLDSENVDFDFGCNGEINGFDLWRLVRFARARFPCFGFESAEEIEKSFDAAVSAGELEYSIGGLYYLTDTPRVLAIDIDSTHPGDMLPSRNHDIVVTLIVHYFDAAILMRENYEKLKLKLNKNGKLSRKDESCRRIYFYSWLGFLAVTCEGFRGMNMRRLLTNERPDDFKELLPLSDGLGKMINVHWDPLREFRNNVFHLRESHEKIRKFFLEDVDRLFWVRELHQAFEHFFSNYRIQCEVHYALNNRKGESDIRRGRRRRPSRT